MKFIAAFAFLLMAQQAAAQVDSAFIFKLKSLDTANVLQADTIAVPHDALTEKIRRLLAERTGLTVGTILKIKIAEEKEKDKKHDAAFYENLEQEISRGHTAQLLDNSLINLYRRTFSESEIDDMIRFYSSPAGKKVDREFLLMMVRSVKGAEQLLKLAVEQLDKKQR